jgi:hypothetical protein
MIECKKCSCTYFYQQKVSQHEEDASIHATLPLTEVSVPFFIKVCAACGDTSTNRVTSSIIHPNDFQRYKDYTDEIKKCKNAK